MILVTGATGNVGSAVCRALNAKNLPFRTATRRPTGAPDQVEFDWDRPETFGTALRGISTLFLLTPVAQQMVAYTESLIRAARAAGVQRIVKLSVLGAHPSQGISFTRMHGQAEELVQSSGLEWTLLRPTAFMQNLVLHYGVDPAHDSTVFLPHGTGRVSWIDVEDIGSVAAEALQGDQYSGKTLELTGPESLDMATVVATLSDALGHRYNYVDVPVEAAHHAMTELGNPPWLVDALMELHGIIRAGYLAPTTSTVEQVLQRPATSLAAFAVRLR